MQFTDVHVGNNRNKPVHTRLEAAVALANMLNPDFVIDTGDITGNPVRGITHESLAEFDTYRQYTSSLNMPLYILPGNHDIGYFNAKDDPRDITWGDYSILTAHFEKIIGPLNQSFVHRNGRFILANNVGEYSRMPGYLSAQQLIWIESEMRTALQNSEDTFLFVHIPVVTKDGSNKPWGNSSAALVSLCNQYKVNLVTFGHDHKPFQLLLDDTLYIEGPDLSVAGHENVLQYRVFEGHFEIWRFNVFDAQSGSPIGTYKLKGRESSPPGPPPLMSHTGCRSKK